MNAVSLVSTPTSASSSKALPFGDAPGADAVPGAPAFADALGAAVGRGGSHTAAAAFDAEDEDTPDHVAEDEATSVEIAAPVLPPIANWWAGPSSVGINDTAAVAPGAVTKIEGAAGAVPVDIDASALPPVPTIAPLASASPALALSEPRDDAASLERTPPSAVPASASVAADMSMNSTPAEDTNATAVTAAVDASASAMADELAASVVGRVATNVQSVADAASVNASGITTSHADSVTTTLPATAAEIVAALAHAATGKTPEATATAASVAPSVATDASAGETTARSVPVAASPDAATPSPASATAHTAAAPADTTPAPATTETPAAATAPAPAVAGETSTPHPAIDATAAHATPTGHTATSSAAIDDSTVAAVVTKSVPATADAPPTASTSQHSSAPISTVQHPSAPFSTVQHPSAPFSTLQHPSAPASALSRFQAGAAGPVSTVQHPSAPFGTVQHPSAPFSTVQHLSAPGEDTIVSVANAWLGTPAMTDAATAREVATAKNEATARAAAGDMELADAPATAHQASVERGPVRPAMMPLLSFDDVAAAERKPAPRAAALLSAVLAQSQQNTPVAFTPPATASASLTDARALQETLDQALPSQLIESIRVQGQQGAGSATVRLRPDHLGEVTVAIAVVNGRVSASVDASSPAVRQWVETNEGLLRDRLAEQGLQLDRLVVTSEETPSDSRDRERRQSREEEAPAPPARRPRADADAPRFEIVL
ncbi:MAG: flagellar hook-length control protein FliK [Acidobacteria bacterium]|nr:flagellar hook-length control protein FliK [Acidobacteriota bacterium]